MEQQNLKIPQSNGYLMLVLAARLLKKNLLYPIIRIRPDTILYVTIKVVMNLIYLKSLLYLPGIVKPLF